MYSLFKLVRLISVKDELNPVTINCSAWRQHGESSLLALACSTGKYYPQQLKVKVESGLDCTHYSNHNVACIVNRTVIGASNQS